MMSEDTAGMVEQHLEMTDLIALIKANEARMAMAEHVDATRRRLLGL
jgi:DNA-binding GntR family transcriptional regulator